ncbi:MAG: sensor domain-containing diguanylate cyclase [Oscillospiraceae bacterium]|nr:sensor domain-containing diguanylate cyclase [Oscillospiraceae bacterium]
MYFSNLKIFILSSENITEQCVLKAAVPDNCDVSVQTAEVFADDKNAVDMMVILDGLTALNKYKSDLSRAVLIVTAEEFESCGDISELADVWIIPSESCKERFITHRTEKLLAQMKLASDHRRLKICSETAFDSIPDLVWFKDIKGAHLMVNNGFCSAVAKTKKQIEGQGHYYIWDIPKEEYDCGDYVCLESEQVVMDARHTCLFDEKVKTKKGMRQFKTYKSPLIDDDGEIFGTCGIANDVTDIHNLNSELNAILNSMPFAIMVAGEQGRVLDTNTLFDELFSQFGIALGENADALKRAIMVNSNGPDEFFIKINNTEYIMSFCEKPIFDIFNNVIGKVNIFNDITTERQRNQQSITNANLDFLTGLNNRRNLFSYLNRNKVSECMHLITMDLDNFKKVNDTYGHDFGDKALVNTATLMKNFFRNDFCARLGGDEFLIVVTRNCTTEEIVAETQKFMDILTCHFRNIKEFEMLTSSAGVAGGSIGTKKVHDFEEIMKFSDTALYHAKRSGKARCMAYFGE